MCYILFSLISMSIVIIAAKILWPSAIIKQMPAIKVIVYSGILILTIIDIAFETSDSRQCLAAAVILSALFEIISNAEELATKSRYKKDKRKNKKEYKVTVEEIFNEE
nr:MAG TPA: hypothetical protein [Caudoviricetes sp.]